MADLLTPEFIGTFVAILRPATNKKDDGTDERKYTIRAAFPPTTDLSALKAAAQEAAIAKWGANTIPKGLKSPFRTYADVDHDFEGIGDDWILMTFSAQERFKPGVVDAKVQDIINEDEVYSGCWFRAQVRAGAYEGKSKGVTFYLQNVQKLRDGEPLGQAKTPASKAFEPVAGAGAAKTASGMFD